MFSKFRKPLNLLVAQSILAISLPLAALAAPSDTQSAPVEGFELPINDVMVVDEAKPSPQANSAPVANATQVQKPAASSKTLPPFKVDASRLKSALELPLYVAMKGDETDGTVLGIEDILQKNEMSPALEGKVEADNVEQQVIVIDSDEVDAQVAEEVWQEMKDEPGMTKVSAGACFPVVVISALSSKLNKVGDPLEARLKTDIKIGGKLIARSGDKVVGHVSSCSKARRMLHAELSSKRWMRANGCIGLQFDEIITQEGDHLPLVAKPAQRARIVKNVNEGRVLGVNDNGEIASPLSSQLKAQGLHLAIRGAASVGGVASFGIVPVAYGIVGAINPSFAFLHPVGKNVPHRRLKGFAMGVASGVPGGFLIADSIIKGVEAEVKPGDEFLAKFHQDFTGEAATSASLIPGASQKVRGEVLNPKKN